MSTERRDNARCNAHKFVCRDSQFPWCLSCSAQHALRMRCRTAPNLNVKISFFMIFFKIKNKKSFGSGVFRSVGQQLLFYVALHSITASHQQSIHRGALICRFIPDLCQSTPGSYQKPCDVFQIR
jgi:hypothetical protein